MCVCEYVNVYTHVQMCLSVYVSVREGTRVRLGEEVSTESSAFGANSSHIH